MNRKTGSLFSYGFREVVLNCQAEIKINPIYLFTGDNNILIFNRNIHDPLY